jgi:hypothetical protein
MEILGLCIPKQRLPLPGVAVALLGLTVMICPAMADVTTLCPNNASQGSAGSSGTFSDLPGPLDTTCGTNSAVTMSITKDQDYTRLGWGAGTAPSGYPAVSLSGLEGAVADVVYSGDDEPYYMLVFQAPSVSLGQTNTTDQILMLEFQPSTLTNSNTTLALDPSTTLFNLYDNTTSVYLGGGQQSTNTLDGWLAADPGLANVQLEQIRIGLGLASGPGTGTSVTVNSLQVTTPEPSSLAVLLMLLGATALGICWKRPRSFGR